MAMNALQIGGSRFQIARARTTSSVGCRRFTPIARAAAPGIPTQPGEASVVGSAGLPQPVARWER
jgi:hypothetical protein